MTYDTLLKTERRLGHGAVARWLSERTQGRGAEFVAMTGEHAERAGETALAVDCFEQAGEEAHKRFAERGGDERGCAAQLALLGGLRIRRRFDLLEPANRWPTPPATARGRTLLHAEMAAPAGAPSRRHAPGAALAYRVRMLARRPHARRPSEHWRGRPSSWPSAAARRCGPRTGARLAGLAAYARYGMRRRAREHARAWRCGGRPGSRTK